MLLLSCLFWHCNYLPLLRLLQSPSIVFVNGVNLGRYWKVGPQQTLYLPGCYLHKGQNTVVVFEQLNDEKKTELVGVDTPVLDRLVKE